MDNVFHEAVRCETLLHKPVLRVNAAESQQECEQIMFTMSAHTVQMLKYYMRLNECRGTYNHGQL